MLTSTPAQAGPALHAVRHWVKATHAENRADWRPAKPYHRGAEHCQLPVQRMKACRWRIAIRWHHHYRVAVHQRALVLIGPSPARAMRLGRSMAAAVGWTGSQWSCLRQLWGHLEGGWWVYSDNPTSEAHGIPQALPGSKMGRGWWDIANVQIEWGLGYVHGRYGTPCGALAFRLANGYY